MRELLNRLCFLFAIALLVSGLLALPERASAQAISGDIVGTGVDKSGAAVPGALIEVENVAERGQFFACGG